MKKVTRWQADDGVDFNSAEEARSHELALDVANRIITELRYPSQWADKVARDIELIALIYKEEYDKTKKSKSREEGST